MNTIYRLWYGKNNNYHYSAYSSNYEHMVESAIFFQATLEVYSKTEDGIKLIDSIPWYKLKNEYNRGNRYD